MADDAKVEVSLPRQSKGSRPRFFEDPSIDQVMTFMLELMAEVTSIRERLDTVETLLETRGRVTRADIEAYQPSPAEQSRRAAWADGFIQRVMRFHQPD